MEEALTDERLLLLVDGLDEWQNWAAGTVALTRLQDYATTRRIPVLAAGRPFGFDQVNNLGPEWRTAYLKPLDAAQHRAFVERWYRHFHCTTERQSDELRLGIA